MRLNKSRWMVVLTIVVLLATFSGTALAAEEGGGPLDALGINAGFLIAQLVNFGLIFVLLTALLWRPLVNMLDARAAKIQKGLEDAQAAANARLNAEAEAEKILQQARTEAQQVIDEARGRGDGQSGGHPAVLRGCDGRVEGCRCGGRGVRAGPGRAHRQELPGRS